MKNILLLLSFLVVFGLNGQEKEIDSLEKVLNYHQADTIERLKILNLLSDNYSTYEANKGLMYADNALEIAKKLNEPKFIALALKNKAGNFYTLGQYEKAKSVNDGALKFFKKASDSINFAKSLFLNGKIYLQISKLDSSMVVLQKAYDIFGSQRDSLQMAITANVMGVSSIFKYDLKQGLKHFLNASELFDRLNLLETEDYASFQSNFGMYYYSIDDHQKAIEHYSRALKIFERINQPISIGNAHSNLGNVYSDNDNVNDALVHYRMAYAAFEKVNDVKGKANTLTNIGIIYFKQGEYKKANDLFIETLPLYQKWDDYKSLSAIYHNLGRVQLQLYKSVNDRNRLIKAQEYFALADEKGKKGGNPIRVLYPKSFSAEVNKLLGNEDYAKEEIIEAYKIKDSILSNQIMRELTQMEEDYVSELEKAWLQSENEKQQALAQAEIESQKSLNQAYLLGGSGILFMAGLGMFFYQRRNNAIRLKEMAEFEAKVADTELKALRAQMNPHFIFNSLNSINSFMLKNDKKTSSEYLRKFAGLMRLTLESSNKKEVLLKEDLELLSSYFEMEAKRLPNKFDYTFKIDETIDLNNTMVPPLIMQPFIENSIWHGIAEKKGKGEISVEIKDRKDVILYVVDDNGVGLSNKEKLNTQKSMGIQLTKDRIAIINATKNKENNVRVIEKEQGLRVEVEIPLNLAF